ncbi:DB module domain-containing protein [Ditylenchus destructor]|nr:DB module domain-containing protein [Ditylenchus destructor]
MIALKLSVFVLLLTVIIADDFKFDPAKDKPFRECCEKRNVHKKFLDVSCTYTALFNSSAGPPLVDKDLISDLPDIVECSAEGKDNIECCKKKGVKGFNIRFELAPSYRDKTERKSQIQRVLRGLVAG